MPIFEKFKYPCFKIIVIFIILIQLLKFKKKTMAYRNSTRKKIVILFIILHYIF